jgi:hypothetical protein
MQLKSEIIEPMLERAEKYGKTTVDLLKLKAVSKTANIASFLFSRLLLFATLGIFTITINIAIALWVGDLLGKTYYGFLLVAAFYGLLAIILALLHSSIKAKVDNSIINQVLN